MKNKQIKIGDLARTNNPEISKDGMLVRIIDTNNCDMVCIRFNDGQEEWRSFEDIKIVAN